MALYVSQRDFPSETPRTQTRIKYIRDDIGAIITGLIQDYFTKHPEGENVTLEVFKALGQEKVVEISNRYHKTIDEIKRDIGLSIPIFGAQIFSPDNFLTYRNEKNGKNSLRKTPAIYRSKVIITNYTPHKIKKSPSIDSVFGIVVSSTDGRQYQNRIREEDKV